MRKSGFILFSSLCTGAAFADLVSITGTVPAKVTINTTLGKSAVSLSKPITFQYLNLSTPAKVALQGRIDELANYGNLASYYYKAAVALPVRYNLGMGTLNNIVLDQGVHGTCVTFAMTAAIDAALGIGDYASQLCALNLGNQLVRLRLGTNSGWNGAWGSEIYSRLMTYGVVSKAYQNLYGCPSGAKAYPVESNAFASALMNQDTYKLKSLKLSNLSGISLANYNTVFSANFNSLVLLNNIKTQLHAGGRVVIGFLLDPTATGGAGVGAVGSRVQPNDSWITTSTILSKARAGRLTAGHEVVVIGYDDTATLKNNPQGGTKGFLIIRNSWGPYAGDKGNYYMSYDYFRNLVDEAMAIRKL